MRPLPLHLAAAVFVLELALLLALRPANAARDKAGPAAGYRPQMTGAQLVRDMLAEPGKGTNSIRRERAMGYIDGIADATVNRDWCPSNKVLPHELNYFLIESIAKLSPARLKGDAAALIISALGRTYPCRTGGAR